MAEPRVSAEGVPIDHLDYGYVRSCKNVKEVEKILRVLRSRSEGYYPDLIRYTEARLKELCPTSKLLIKSEKAKRMSDLPFEESRRINADLDNWTNLMSSKDSRHTNGPTSGRHSRVEADCGEEEADTSLPPIRTKGSITKGQTGMGATNNDTAAGMSQRIPSHDFRAWDRFDADEAAEKVDKSEKKKSGSSVDLSPKGIPVELSEAEKSMSSADKEKAALREKNKGNEAYRSGDHQEALLYYTRSIEFHPTAPAFNNRAITEIKLGRHQEAIHDCDAVLRLEHKNTKALFRRATAYTNVKEYRAAADDLERVLQLEPNNKKIQEELNRLKRDHLETAVPQKQHKKGRRIEIVESDGEDEESSSEGEKETVSEPTAPQVQSERKDTTDGSASSDVKEEACKTKGKDSDTACSGNDGNRAAKYSTNGPISSPGSEDPTTPPTNHTPQSKETPPLNTKQTSDRVQSKEAPPTSDAAKDVPKSMQDVPQTSSAAEAPKQPSQVQEAPPPMMPVAPPPELPPSVKKLKEEGNDMFRRGQYGDAVNRYTKGIKTLEKSSKAHIPNISTLLNNRAACHLKNGNTRDCINDCTKSLELVPVNLKALMRRAQAYEALERYKHAYNDFHLALRVDSSVEAAYTACSRITKILQDLDGLNWRSKLPPHPDAERVKAALAEHKYRSGSVGGLPLLSTFINVDQSSSSSSGGGSGGTAAVNTNGSNSDHRESSEPETPSVGGGGGASVGAAPVSEPTDGGKREKKKEERKEQTEERVPEIPPLNVTATSTSTPQVTQTTQPVSSPHHSDAPPPRPTLSQLPPEQKFEQLKAEGNEHVKKGEYVEALNCYSLCVNTCPNRVVAYTNRALCHLKLKSPRSAEEDCTIALSFDPNNIKALYRRALARRALGRYMEAAKDLSSLLDLDPMNSAGRIELIDMKPHWEKQLREIQVQQVMAKEALAAASSRKSKSGKSRGSSKKKSGHRKASKETPRTSPLAELQKTRQELEKLLQEATRLSGEAKKATSPANQSRKSELDKLVKETKAKKVAESKSRESKMAESKTGESTNKSPTSMATPTATPTEARVTEEKSSDVSTNGNSRKSKSESGDHVTPTKTTKNKGKGKRSKGAKTTPPKTPDVPVAEEAKSSPAGGTEREEPASKVKRKKIIVEEGSDSEAEEGVDGQATPAPAASQDMSSSTPTSMPTDTDQQETAVASEDGEAAAALLDFKEKEKLASPYEFVQRWNSIPRTAQSIEYARLLEQITPETLPEVITNKLDGMMLTNIIRAIDKQFVPKRQYKLSVDILLYLTKVPRFEMNAMFLGPIEKEDLKKVFTVLSEHRDEISVPPAMLQTMKRSYGLDSAS